MNRIMELSKMKKLAKVIRKILMLFYVLMWIGFGMSVFMMIVSVSDMHQDSALISAISSNLGLMTQKMLMQEGINLGVLYKMSFLAGVPYMVQAIVIVKMIIGILQNLEIEKPFEPSNASRLFVIGVAMIGAFIIRGVMILVIGLGFIPEFRDNMTITITPTDYLPILEGIVIILISWVFKYGAYLQGEYDETV